MELETSRTDVRFYSRGGILNVARDGPMLIMDFPASRSVPCAEPPKPLLHGLGQQPTEVFMGDAGHNYHVCLENEEAVRGLQPDLSLFETLHPHGLAVTAPGTNADFVSRYFAPSYGIPEDPVTGSIHNQIYLLSVLLAHNLARELQMIAHPPSRITLEKRPAFWDFLRLATIRRRLIQRAGRLIRPQRQLTLSMSGNADVRDDLLHYLEALKAA